MLLVPVSSGQTRGQSQKSNRESFGDVRANIMESLLVTVFPGARFRWSPDLQIEHSSGIFSDVQFPGFTFSIAPDGSLYGASGIELAHAKEQAIFLSKQLRQPNHKHFASTIVVFRATIQGQVTKVRTLELDPEDPLAEVKLIHVTDWSNNPWPVLLTGPIICTKWNVSVTPLLTFVRSRRGCGDVGNAERFPHLHSPVLG